MNAANRLDIGFKNRFLDEFGFHNPVSFRKNGGMKMAKPQRKMRKVEDNIVKFEKAGDSVEGKLIARETGANFGNEVYKLEDDNGKTYAVFGTTILSTRMAGIAIGKWIKIEFTGTTKNSNPKLNDIKQFDVSIEE